jgi:hypothetical protein
MALKQNPRICYLCLPMRSAAENCLLQMLLEHLC